MENSFVLFSPTRIGFREKVIPHRPTRVRLKRTLLRVLGFTFVSLLAWNCGVPLQTFAADVVGESPVTYQIDPTGSQFTVQVFTGGLFKVFAHNHRVSVKDFDGSVQLAGAAIETASLKLRIQAGSLTIVDAEMSEKDRAEIQNTMGTKVLEVTRYPEISFSSVRVSALGISDEEFEVKIDGELQLHGVKRHEVIPARVTIHNRELRARGEFSLKQTDYLMKPVSVAGGTVKVKDEVKLSFDIVAMRQ